MGRFSLILFALATLSGCARTPLSLVETRYQNMGEERQINTVFQNEHTAILVGSKEKDGCTEEETIAVSRINFENEWHIIRAQNRLNCPEDSTK